MVGADGSASHPMKILSMEKEATKRKVTCLKVLKSVSSLGRVENATGCSRWDHTGILLRFGPSWSR